MMTNKLPIILAFVCLTLPVICQDVASLPCDPKDNQPVIIGVTSREMILRHRPLFRERESEVNLSPETVQQLKNIDPNLRVVIVFGSWCSDTQRYLPSILALDRFENQQLSFTYIGVSRSKEIAENDWPSGLPFQLTTKVPSIWVFRRESKNKWVLKGSIIEHPSDPLMPMSTDLLHLLSN